MESQKLCLKWNNHTTNLLTVLGNFRQKDHLVDVTISCEGRNTKAHKVILSACSPYFEDIFQQNPCQHPIIIMNGMKYEDITAILNFMYKGEVNVSQDGLTSFLQAAEALKVKGLAEVCGEKSNTNSINKEIKQSDLNRPQRTDTPPRKRHRNRKRSLSDSNRSDDEGTSRKQHREPSSPEIHELSGDESFTGDNSSNGPPFNSTTPRVPQNVYSRSHQSSSNMGGEEDEFEVEPSKMLEQTLTTEPASNSNSDNNLRIERIMGNATEIESSSLQEPESPPDIKPIIDFGESSAGPSESAMMLYNEQSQPGPSNMQDGSLLHDNSHAQAQKAILKLVRSIIEEQKELRTIVHRMVPNPKVFPEDCPEFPVTSSEGLQDLDDCLRNKESFLKVITLMQNGTTVSSVNGTPASRPVEAPQTVETPTIVRIQGHSNKSPPVPEGNCLTVNKKILKEIRGIKEDLKEVKALLYPKISPTVVASLKRPKVCPELPVQEVENLAKLNSILEDEEKFLQICSFLSSTGGVSVKDCTRRVLSRILTNPLSMEYNWKGSRGDKLPFASLSMVVKLIYAAVRSTFESATDHEVNDIIKKWLMHAKDRDGGRNKRVNQPPPFPALRRDRDSSPEWTMDDYKCV